MSELQKDVPSKVRNLQEYRDYANRKKSDHAQNLIYPLLGSIDEHCSSLPRFSGYVWMFGIPTSLASACPKSDETYSGLRVSLAGWLRTLADKLHPLESRPW